MARRLANPRFELYAESETKILSQSSGGQSVVCKKCARPDRQADSLPEWTGNARQADQLAGAFLALALQ